MEDDVKTLNEEFREILSKVHSRKDFESTPEIEELRKLRNEAYNKSQEYQKQIDAKIMELHKTPDIVGQYVKVAEIGGVGDSDITTTYGLVSHVSRLFKGIGLEFDKMFEVSYYKEGVSVYMRTNLGSGNDVTVEWGEFDKIEVITKDDYQLALEDAIKYIK